jgi:hypothetical protein
MEQSTVTAFDEVSRTGGEAVCFESDAEAPEQPARRATNPSRRNFEVTAGSSLYYTGLRAAVPTLDAVSALASPGTRRETNRGEKPMKILLVFAGIGAALAYFFDPQNGVRRRNMTRDQTLAFFRQGGRKAERAGRAVAAEAYGLKQKATHLREEEKAHDDVTLARKVETELFRPADAPKGQVNVNVENGVVFLRGEVERPEIIKDLEGRARKVQGVREVENLLHLAGSPAPTQQK